MRAHFGLPSVRGGAYILVSPDVQLVAHVFGISEQDMDKRAPITVKFEIPYFTVSGIQVRYLKIVEKSGYQALPWVRYITQNGDDYRYAAITQLKSLPYSYSNLVCGRRTRKVVHPLRQYNSHSTTFLCCMDSFDVQAGFLEFTIVRLCPNLSHPSASSRS